MSNRLATTIAALAVILVANLCLLAQVTGSITGAVVDANGSVVPNATVVVKGEGGQEFTVTTNENGHFRVPGVAVEGAAAVAKTFPGFWDALASLRASCG